MAPKGKRKHSHLLKREEERVKRLKEEHAAELEQLRQNSAAKDAELNALYSRIEGEAAKKAEDVRLRPTYAPIYVPMDPRMRMRSPDAIITGEPWPELKDDNKITEKDRQSSSYLRLSPPRAGDSRLISMYEAIDISEEDLNRDRSERHIRKTEKLTVSYQSLDFNEVDVDIGDLDYALNESYAEEDNLGAAYQNVSFGEAEMKERGIGNDDRTRSERCMEADNPTAPYQGSHFGEARMGNRTIRGDNLTQDERRMKKANMSTASSQSSRIGEKMGDRGIQDGNRTGESSRSAGAAGNPLPEEGYDDWWLHGFPDSPGSPVDLYEGEGSSIPSYPEAVAPADQESTSNNTQREVSVNTKM